MLTLRVTLLVAAAVSVTLASCPTGWLRYGEKCYKTVNTAVHWIDGRNQCWSLYPGSDMVSVHDLLENAFIAETLLGGSPAWLGLHCTNCTGSYPQGCTWTDGSPYDYTNWYGGSAAISGECCAAINWHANQGDWSGFGCTSSTAYLLCQISAV